MNDKSLNSSLSDFIKKATVIFLIGFVSACTITRINDPIDEKDLVHGKELVGAKIPINKALLEFTTNSSIPVSLTETVGGSSCKPEKKNQLATATKAFDLSKPVNARDLDGNMGWYRGVGWGETKLFAYAPEQSFFYVDAGAPLTLTAYALLRTGNGVSTETRSCGPLYIKFQPQPEKRYRYTFVAKGSQCSSQLEEWGADDLFKSVPFESWACDGSKRVTPKPF